MVNCLADQRVAQFLDGMVDAEVEDGERIARDDHEPFLLQHRDVCRRDQVEAVDGSRLQRLCTGLRVIDDPEDDLLDITLLTPVLLIGGNRQALTDVPGLELEGAGTDRVPLGVFTQLRCFCGTADVICTVFLQCGGALHGEGRK